MIATIKMTFFAWFRFRYLWNDLDMASIFEVYNDMWSIYSGVATQAI